MITPLLRTVLVVGATSSLAQALCHALAERGYDFALMGRDGEELELLACDLMTRVGAKSRIITTDFLSGDFSAQRTIEQAGDFDHAIIAVGDMGSEDALDMKNIAETVWINYTVPAQLATLAAEHLAAKKTPGRKYVGSISLISSVAGDRGRQSNYAYGSAKAALNTFASGLRNRYFKRGVHVMTVKPGFTDTPMTWDMTSPLMASREDVAQRIASAMHKRKNVIYAPSFWRYIMLIIIHIPEGIFKRLSL